MFTAKVKYPYKKEWEKDVGYGPSAPITLESNEIGDYRQYINSVDEKKQWIRELKKGDQVYLEQNMDGNGYIIKPAPVQNNSIDIVKNNAEILGACIREIEKQLKTVQTGFTSEDVRCLAISMYIQLTKAKRADFLN